MKRKHGFLREDDLTLSYSGDFFPYAECVRIFYNQSLSVIFRELLVFSLISAAIIADIIAGELQGLSFVIVLDLLVLVHLVLSLPFFFRLLRLGKKLRREKESDTEEREGTVEQTKRIPMRNVFELFFGKVCAQPEYSLQSFAMNGETYYLFPYQMFSVGEHVKIKVMPKSHVILKYELLPKGPAPAPTEESDS